MKLDLDPILAAEAEASETTHEITLRGKKFILPPELPFVSAMFHYRGNDEMALRPLLNHKSKNDKGTEVEYEQWADFIGLNLTLVQVRVVYTRIVQMYLQAESGESSASSDSSSPTSKRSRPTSTSTGDETSEETSGEKKEPVKAD